MKRNDNLSYSIKFNIPKHVNDITIKGCTFNTIAPQQFCFLCGELYDPYMVDDDLWNKLSKNLLDKYLCPKCLKIELLDYIYKNW